MNIYSSLFILFEHYGPEVVDVFLGDAYLQEVFHNAILIGAAVGFLEDCAVDGAVTVVVVCVLVQRIVSVIVF